MVNKVTKRFMFTAIRDFLAVAAPNMDATPEGMEPSAFLEDACKFLSNEIALVERKHNASPNPAKVAEQTAFMQSVTLFLAGAAEPQTATQVAAGIGVSVQRATAILKKVVTAGTVVREQDGKKVVFRYAE
jgi:hypothetical protein